MIYSRNEILSFLENNKVYLREHFKVTKIGIFGSYANGTQTEESDIDIILEFEDQTCDLFDKKLELKKFFGEKFGKHIDICREKAIKPIFRDYILKQAIYV